MAINNDVDGLKKKLSSLYANRNENTWKLVYATVTAVDQERNMLIHSVSHKDILKSILGTLFLLASGDYSKINAIVSLVNVKNLNNLEFAALAGLNGRKDLLEILVNFFDKVFDNEVYKEYNIGPLNLNQKAYIKAIIEWDILNPAITFLNNHILKNGNNENIQGAINLIEDYLNKKNRAKENKKSCDSGDTDLGSICMTNSMAILADASFLTCNELTGLDNSTSNASNKIFSNQIKNIPAKGQRIEEKRFKCKWNFCPEIFGYEKRYFTHVNGHISSIIKEEKNCFVCKWDGNTCLKLFKYPSQLQIHIRIHTGEKLYLCEQCNKKFTRKNSLDRHVLITHTGEKSQTRFNVIGSKN